MIQAVRLEWTLNVGTLLSIAGAMFLFVWRFHVSTVNKIESSIRQLADRTTEMHMAVFERIHELDIRLTKLEDRDNA